jgi:hypothetical protein
MALGAQAGTELMGGKLLGFSDYEQKAAKKADLTGEVPGGNRGCSALESPDLVDRTPLPQI